MRPTDRVRTIKDISRVLGKEEWSIIDLTLKQFDMSTDDYWRGDDRTSYIISMISEADAPLLANLADHLGIASVTVTSKTPSFWLPEQPRIFFSHLASMKTETIAISKVLENHGIACFVAHEDIEPTKEWQTEIESALMTMDVLIALLTPGFNDSKWTDQEVGVAIGRDIPVIPIRIGLDPYGFIGKYQALQGKGKTGGRIAKELIKLLTSKQQVAVKISKALVGYLEKSSSWAQAKRIMTQIEGCNHFSAETIEKLKAIPKVNLQVGGAFGVPERIKAVVKNNGG